MMYLRDMYGKIERFRDKTEQGECELRLIKEGDLKIFEELDRYGEYSIYFIGALIELFIRMEKNHPNPFIFIDLINALIQEKDIFSIVSKATHN